MYRDNWLVMGDSQTSTTGMIWTTINTSTSWKFCINLSKSHLVLSQILQCLGFTWDTRTQTLALYATWILQKLFMALASFTRRIWECPPWSSQFCRGACSPQQTSSSSLKLFKATKSFAATTETEWFLFPDVSSVSSSTGCEPII